MPMLLRLRELFRNRESQRTRFSWMINKTRPYLASILLLLLLDIVLTAISLGTTVMSKRLIDRAIGSAGQMDLSGLIVLSALTVGSILIGTLVGALSTLVQERFAFSVRGKVFDHVLKGRWSAVNAYHSEDLVTRLTSDVDAVSNGISTIIPNAIYLIVQLAASFALLYYYDPTLAFLALALGPVGTLSGFLFTGKLKKYQVQLKESESAYRALMQESLVNLSVTKSFQQEGAFLRRLRGVGQERLSIMRRRNLINSGMRLCINTVFSFGYLLAFGASIYRLARGEITYGTMSAFLTLVSRVQGPVTQLGSLIPQFVSTLASAGRVMELNSVPLDRERGGESAESALGVRFDGVSFAYATDPVLRNVSVEIRPGETVALIGESGAGKTTFARLIIGLIEPQRGQIHLTRENGSGIAVDAGTRGYIAYVPQGNTLFSGNIRDNLRMGDANASDAEMMRALEIADALFVRQLPDGLNTILTERGGTISEGQAQRIAIARAILRRRPLLILDEATSALDIQTEKNIVGNLRAKLPTGTCVVISHRPSLWTLCSRVYRLTGGKLHYENNEDMTVTAIDAEHL